MTHKHDEKNSAMGGPLRFHKLKSKKLVYLGSISGTNVWPFWCWVNDTSTLILFVWPLLGIIFSSTFCVFVGPHIWLVTAFLSNKHSKHYSKHNSKATTILNKRNQNQEQQTKSRRKLRRKRRERERAYCDASSRRSCWRKKQGIYKQHNKRRNHFVP